MPISHQICFLLSLLITIYNFLIPNYEILKKVEFDDHHVYTKNDISHLKEVLFVYNSLCVCVCVCVRRNKVEKSVRTSFPANLIIQLSENEC